MAEVRKLREDEEVHKVIASGVSITVGLADDRQMTFQTGFEGDESDASINARFDRMLGFADRLKARYAIPTLEEELRICERTVANLQEDRPNVEARFAQQQAARQVEMDTCKAVSDSHIVDAQKRKAELERVSRERHNLGAKRGAWKPQGATLADIEKQDHAIEQFGKIRAEEMARIQLEMDKAEAERKLWTDNSDKNLERHLEGVAYAREKLAAAKALIGS